jgi:hypothetical protein
MPKHREWHVAVKNIRFEGDRGGADARKRWIHANGEFIQLAQDVWQEKSPNGNTYRYKEVTRTQEYVELDALNGDTTLRYRLYDDRCESGKKGGANFASLFAQGKWVP